MNIGLIGSGGREHAICKKLYESKLVNNIFCFQEMLEHLILQPILK